MKTESDKKNTAIKNFFLVLFGVVTLIAVYIAYDQHSKKEIVLEQIQVEKSKYEKVFFETLNQIEQNLAEISAHEGVINGNIYGVFSEGPISPEKRIQQEIDIIEALMLDNRILIEQLTAQVNDKNSQLASYSSKVHDLNKRIKTYEVKLADFTEANKLLTENLAVSNQENNLLQDDIANKSDQLLKQSQELEQKDELITTQADGLAHSEKMNNTAYYVVGSFQDLKSANVLEKNGGIAGIGGTKMLKDDFNKAQFVRIDKRNYTLIPVYSKKAELVTLHARSSYEWVTDENGVTWLKIKDTEKFWENNNYLVVVTKDGLGNQIAQND